MSVEAAKVAMSLRADTSTLIAESNNLGTYVAQWYHAEMNFDDDRAGMEVAAARTSVRELKRQLDAIMEKLGGW